MPVCTVTLKSTTQGEVDDCKFSSFLSRNSYCKIKQSLSNLWGSLGMCVSIGKEWVFSDLNLAHSTQGCKLLYVYRNHAQQHTHTSKNNTPGNSFEIHFGDAGLNSTKQQEARLSRTDYCTYFFLPFSLFSVFLSWARCGKKKENSTYCTARNEKKLL